MKKLCVFLMTILASTVVFATDVYAQSTFHEAELIGGVYMTREKGKTRIYEQARFVRRDGDNKEAYCIEPFTMFQEGGSYEASSTIGSLTGDQINKITKIAYYGYGNKALEHYDPMWYAAAQHLIWQVVEPAGNYYFTDKLNGNPVSTYDRYMNEINQHVAAHDVTPSFGFQTFTLAQNSSIEIQDTNQVLQYFSEDSDMLSINPYNNTLKIEGLKPGNYDFVLTKNFDNYGEEFYFFDHPGNQNLMVVGKLQPVTTHITVNIKETEVEFTKLDADTESTTPSGEAELKGAEYDILDENEEVVKHFVIGDDSKAVVKNLAFGTYYVKETKAGVGYKLDEELHEFTIDENNTKLKIELENEVIKKKVEIHKKYGNDTDAKAEEGIVFNVFNSKGELVDSMITDQNGYAYIELPYGHYTIKQETSTEGYEKVDDFTVDITDEGDDDVIEFDLLDYVIEVPNTNVNHQDSLFLVIFMIIFGFVYVKKEIRL